MQTRLVYRNRIELNGKLVNFQFSIQLNSISVNQSSLHAGYVCVDFTFRTFQVLAFVSYKWLTVQENIYLLFDFAISDATMGRIKCFAELVWHLLFNLTTGMNFCFTSFLAQGGN